MGIHWPQVIRNEDLWERTEKEKINIQIRRRKFDCNGYTLFYFTFTFFFYKGEAKRYCNASFTILHKKDTYKKKEKKGKSEVKKAITL